MIQNIHHFSSQASTAAPPAPASGASSAAPVAPAALFPDAVIDGQEEAGSGAAPEADPLSDSGNIIPTEVDNPEDPSTEQAPEEASQGPDDKAPEDKSSSPAEAAQAAVKLAVNAQVRFILKKVVIFKLKKPFEILNFEINQPFI